MTAKAPAFLSFIGVSGVLCEAPTKPRTEMPAAMAAAIPVGVSSTTSVSVRGYARPGNRFAVKVGGWLGAGNMVDAQNSVGEETGKAGYAQLMVKHVAFAIGSDRQFCGQLGESFRNMGDRLQKPAKIFHGVALAELEKALRQFEFVFSGKLEPLAARRSPGEPLLDCFRREVNAEAGEQLSLELGGEDLAVDEHAVAIENDVTNGHVEEFKIRDGGRRRPRLHRPGA